MMKRLFVRVIAIVVVGLFASRASAADWRILPTPSTGNLNQLNAAAAISFRDAWAVGTTGLPDFNSLGVTLHWDGHAWSVVPSPIPLGAAAVNLLGVAATSSRDVWAVGRSIEVFTTDALALHWDGSAWSIVQTPQLSGGATFQAVTALSADDVWAVGQDAVGFLTEHWDGQSWSVVPTPIQGNGGDLTAVGGTASNDVWAVGSFFDQRFAPHTIILHWDGAAWSVSPSPDNGANSELEGVAAISANDVWAVGHSFPTNVATLAEHWDGSFWTVVPGPDIGIGQFHAVVAVSPSDVWAVGSVVGQEAHLQALAEQWNGTEWVRSRMPTVNQISELLGITATPRAVMAAGDAMATPQSPQLTLIEAHRP